MGFRKQEDFHTTSCTIELHEHTPTWITKSPTQFPCLQEENAPRIANSTARPNCTKNYNIKACMLQFYWSKLTSYMDGLSNSKREILLFSTFDPTWIERNYRQFTVTCITHLHSRVLSWIITITLSNLSTSSSSLRRPHFLVSPTEEKRGKQGEFWGKRVVSGEGRGRVLCACVGRGGGLSISLWFGFGGFGLTGHGPPIPCNWASRLGWLG